MHQVIFYTGETRIKDQTYATRGEALAAIEAWEDESRSNSCSLEANHYLPRV